MKKPNKKGYLMWDQHGKNQYIKDVDKYCDQIKKECDKLKKSNLTIALTHHDLTVEIQELKAGNELQTLKGAVKDWFKAGDDFAKGKISEGQYNKAYSNLKSLIK